jgi:hypothetical protein
MKVSLQFTVLALALSLVASQALGQGKKGKESDGEKVKVNSDESEESDLLRKSSRNIDFSETLIEGKFKAPQGFFLQGRQAQSLSQMVQLRSNFKSELRNSRASVKSIVK